MSRASVEGWRTPRNETAKRRCIRLSRPCRHHHRRIARARVVDGSTAEKRRRARGAAGAQPGGAVHAQRNSLATTAACSRSRAMWQSGRSCDRRSRSSSHHFGRIDMLVNNAGVMHVGPLEHMAYGDYHQAMNVHFWGALHCTEAVLPYMRRRRSGRIVNIASIGGLIAVPHLAPYSASKFALVGYSDAVRAEVAKDGIRVTTVCPGLMRTGSAVNALVKGRHEAEFAWFGTLSSLPRRVDRRAARGAENRGGGASRRSASDDYAAGATRGDSRSADAEHVRQNDDGGQRAAAAARSACRATKRGPDSERDPRSCRGCRPCWAIAPPLATTSCC